MSTVSEASSNLPPFLHPSPPPPGYSIRETMSYQNAVFQHKRIPSEAHVLWWASRGSCDTCLIFIPGNPGIVEFYTPFLTALHEKSDERLCVLAHAHVGHTEGLHKTYDSPTAITLASQVEAIVEVVDAVKTSYTNIVIIGHSVGSWLVLQALKAREDVTDSAFLLFPTIAHIVKTPNGRQLSWLFRRPFPSLISWLSAATRLVPSWGLKFLFPDWPDAQLVVLRALLDSPDTVYSCLTMAHGEMTTIKDLDAGLLERNKHLLHLYLAEVDAWVGENRTAILEVFHPYEDSLRIVHGPDDIPHAFCITPEPPESPSQRESSPEPQRELSPELTSLTTLTRSPQPPKPVVFVELPTLPPRVKEQYATDLSERVLTFAEQFPRSEMKCIIGEYQTQSQLFYFVKLSDDVAFRFAADKFKVDNPDLVEDYERKKETGELPPFDPSAAYVHPSSRIKMVIKLKPEMFTSRSGHTSDADTDELVIDDHQRSPSDSDSAYGESDESESLLRRTTRATTAKGSKMKQMTLPFSPKKTRTRKIMVVSDNTDEEDNSVIEVTPPRRSTRSKKATRMNLDDEAYEDDGDYVDDESEQRTTIKIKPKRSKASRPAYGHIRPVSDLVFDEDEEVAILRKHRDVCEKCGEAPTHILLRRLHKRKGNKRRKSKRSEDEFEEDGSDEDKITAKGGWVRCLKCPVAAHWACLARTQRDEILRAAHEKDRAEWRRTHPDPTPEVLEGDVLSGPSKPKEEEPIKRAGLEPNQTTEFVCGQCMKGGVCMGCMEVALKPDTIHRRALAQTSTADNPDPSKPLDGDVEMKDAEQESDEPGEELLFRCRLCKRICHYAHLPLSPFADPHEEYSAADRAWYYQHNAQWNCADCQSWVYGVEHIIAWRPYPSDAIEPPLPAGEVPNYKSHLPREYLIKWENRSYRRTQWVPHMWLLAAHGTKLKNFLSGGSRVTLLPEPVHEAATDAMQLDEPLPEFGVADEEMGEENDNASSTAFTSLDPIPDAEKRIRPAWKTVDRALDALLWAPTKRLDAIRTKKKRSKGKSKAKRRVNESDDDATEAAEEIIERERKAAFDDGEQPSVDLMETVDEWEKRNRRGLRESDIDLVVWGFFKWHGLGYDDATWDSPPRKEDPAYKSFELAFKRFLASRKVTVKVLSKKEIELFDHDLPKNIFMKRFAFTNELQPKLGQSEQLSLMPFQIDGVNWLCNNWWNRQPCILADEMGLGKTVQIVTFLGTVIRGGFKGFEQLKGFPALVVVPNSTITNWVREFERWAPHLRVVPFYGDNKSREVIKNYELFHSAPTKDTTGAKYHVLVTTYETVINNKEFTPVFKSTPRWEVLVVDEGQRLKSDSSLIFRKLKELKTVHRIILTGTPLNNNIRELFNLMNFLDPSEWRDLESLAKEYEVLTEDSIKELHNRLRPYFLRRVKSEVLELPPKNEVIVPVSMSALQKEVYRSILSQNLDLLQSLAQTAAGTKINAAVKKSNMNNMLMQLRKCLQHPYLVSREIEPTGLAPTEAHEKLIGASAKLLFLHTLLPKLKARGHRVLLFSQFVIALDIIEDFLTGENIKFLRLDGNTKQADRQRDMDEFNRPDSDVFIYILSTRAGGVGINLWTADTVIIFDPDFNPHQDLQAIARAHRYGQKKTCLVFKLMVKDSAEERIIQTGKKKLVLDHLIVQKMDDDDDAEDMKSILMFGAQALFQEGDDHSARDIHYSEHDIDNLIEKTEKEGDQQEPQTSESAAFSFAKIWAADKDSLEDVNESETQAQEDAWAQTLARIAEEQAKERAKEVTGRGVRRKAAAVFPQQSIEFDDSPKKNQPAKKKSKVKSKATISDDDDAYVGSPHDSEGESSGPASSASDGLVPDLADLKNKIPAHKRKSLYVDDIARPLPTVYPPLSPILNRPSLSHQGGEACGLCGLSHPESACFMTESSENLAQYRNMLLTHSGDEALEDRQAAIDVIDETLYKRGQMHLIYGQPLHPVDPPAKQRAMQQVSTVLYPQAASSSNNVQVSRPTPGPSSVPRKVDRPAVQTGSSKRPASPSLPGRTSSKKVKGTPTADSLRCLLCGQLPSHSLKVCPVAAQGSQRLEKEIERLKRDASVSPGYLDVLNNFLIRLRQKELSAGSRSLSTPKPLKLMVKAQVNGLNMQSDPHQWFTHSTDGTWSSSSTGTSNAKATSHSPAPSQAGLKRQRETPTTMNSNLPPIPKLSGDIILTVFTHRSLRFPGALIDEDSDYGDNERLAVLGEKVLETAVTDTLFKKRPMLKATEIEDQRKEFLSPKAVDSWIVGYKLREKLRCSPDSVDKLNSPEETYLLFNSYVGAVYATMGMPVVQSWIGALVDPEFDGSMEIDVDTDPLYNPKKFKMDQMVTPPEPSSIPPPPPPLNPPPPLPNPLAPAQQSTAFLPLFNQTANQRRVFVEYPAQFSGPPHAGKWTVKCVVNGMEKGIGSGASKQLAKEEAAKQAYFAMGWAPRG
ncbi:hypothetical protein NM688_g2999 [Phlebia brevispora]|uniref:Uncharacterized protein n=1 Tax=Phlebia brevispora TaxID=194682 RepID=A0ACC1T6Q4_9APHY|nr:hypothetical protein NM688_g2999 [Phlebia brevispora]